MTSAAVQDQLTSVFSTRQPLISDEACTLIAPLLPVAAATGRPRKWALRLLLEAVLYLLRTGCQWRALPDAFPPYSTVQRRFYEWRDAGLFERVNHLLVMLDRERVGREASPSAGVIDSQSVKTNRRNGAERSDGIAEIMEPHAGEPGALANPRPDMIDQACRFVRALAGKHEFVAVKTRRRFQELDRLFVEADLFLARFGIAEMQRAQRIVDLGPFQVGGLA